MQTTTHVRDMIHGALQNKTIPCDKCAPVKRISAMTGCSTCHSKVNPLSIPPFSPGKETRFTALATLADLHAVPRIASPHHRTNARAANERQVATPCRRGEEHQGVPRVSS
eukprot:6851727-Pyramimonas_sp.AAC.1